MTTTEKIKEMKGLKDSFIFAKLGVSKSSFYNAVQGKREFKESEIAEIDRIWKIYKML